MGWTDDWGSLSNKGQRYERRESSIETCVCDSLGGSYPLSEKFQVRPHPCLAPGFRGFLALLRPDGEPRAAGQYSIFEVSNGTSQSISVSSLRSPEVSPSATILIIRRL